MKCKAMSCLLVAAIIFIENLSHDFITTPEMMKAVPATGSLNVNEHKTSDFVDNSGLFGFSIP